MNVKIVLVRETDLKGKILLYELNTFYCINSNKPLFADPKPYKIIKLKKREATQLLSPNYPEKEPAGSTARWTVVSDMDRRIVLVCPFYHSIKETYTPEVCKLTFLSKDGKISCIFRMLNLATVDS